MISKNIIEAVVKQAKLEKKDVMLSAFITKFAKDNKYNENKVNYCLELLVGKANPVTPDDVDMDYIKRNINNHIYKSEDYIIKDIELKSIDNIEGIVEIDYNSKRRINEDRDDIDFNRFSTNISFIDYPQVLKKS